MSEPRTPLLHDISYGVISLGSTAIWSVLTSWLLYFYLPPDGDPLVPAAVFSAIMLGVRVVGALVITPIGYLSDRTHTRWGRRLPYMALSGLPMLLLFVLLWTPPVAGASVWNAVYLLLTFTLYSIAYSIYQIPYVALMPEIAVTDPHRVRLAAWNSGFLLVGMIVSGLAGPLIERLGYVWTAIIYAAIAFPTLYGPITVLRERTERATSPPRLSFRESIATVLRNPAFRILTGAGILYWSTTALIPAALPYIATEICQLSTADTMVFYIPAILASLACYPVVTWLSDRQGKWRVFSGSLIASAVVFPGLMLISDSIPISLKAQGIIWVTLQAIASAGVTMLPPAFGAEITDDDAKRTGERREGAYYATWGLFDQLVNGIAAATLPLLLLLGSSRSDPHGPLGVRMVGLVCGLFMVIAFLIFQRYPFRERVNSARQRQIARGIPE